MSENPFSVSESYAAESVDSEALPLERGSKRSFYLVELAVVIFIIVIIAGLLMPGESSPRGAARRMKCSNNLKQLAFAMHNYERFYGSFPPAYTVDAKGNCLHSWRTLILPFIEQQPLYDKIDLSKPWDHPVNAKFGSLDIPVFNCPSCGGPPAVPPGSSTYVVVDDPSGIFNGSNATKMAQIQDGTSTTLLIVEVDAKLVVPWMSPNDIDMQTYLAAEFKPQHEGGANCCLADGSCLFVRSSLDRASIRSLVTKSAGDESNNALP